MCGNVFTSPSSEGAGHVARAAHSGAGVVFCYGDYTGDVMKALSHGQHLGVVEVVVLEDHEACHATELADESESTKARLRRCGPGAASAGRERTGG